MALTPGSRLDPYEVTALLGEGGMGQVYRAIDTNLKRQVAIKVLPASVALDPDRLARFQREAEVLAALNHPHIAAIYGLEKTRELGSENGPYVASDGANASYRLVLEAELFRAGDLAAAREELIEHLLVELPRPVGVGVGQRGPARRRDAEVRQAPFTTSPSTSAFAARRVNKKARNVVPRSRVSRWLNQNALTREDISSDDE